MTATSWTEIYKMMDENKKLKIENERLKNRNHELEVDVMQLKAIYEAAIEVNKYEDFASPGYCEHCLDEGADPKPWTDAREKLHELLSDYTYIINELKGGGNND